MRKDFVDVYDLIEKEWGIESQHIMCIEEMSELTKELCKLSRYKGSEKESMIVENVREEIADCINMLEQLERFYGEAEIESIRKNKIDRLLSANFNKKC